MHWLMVQVQIDGSLYGQVQESSKGIENPGIIDAVLLII